MLEQQIATDVAAYVLPTESTGMMLVQATAKEDVPIEQVESALDAEIARVAGEGVSEDELTRAKNRAEVEFAHQVENYDSRADLIGMMATYFGEPARVHSWLDPYRGTARDAIVNIAARYLVPDNRVTSIFAPGGEA